jgi:hypothetical protein
VRLLLLSAAVLAAACSDDADTPVGSGERDVLQLVAYSQGMDDQSQAATRAVTLPTGYHVYEGPNEIGVYTTTEETAPDKISTFTYINGSWNSLVSVIQGLQYYIYGYMPVAYKSAHEAPTYDIDCKITKRTGKKFDEGAVLTFSGLPPVLAEDFCVVTGVLQLNTKESDGELVAKKFDYTGKANGSNFVCLMLDHLYSAVQFHFLVDKNYNELRTIKLKKVELKTTYDKTYPLVVEMKKDEDYSLTWGTATAPSWSNDYVTLFTSDDGKPICTSEEVEADDKKALVVDGYFIPMNDVAKLELRCTYDVYDKNGENGNLVRKNCKSVNKLYDKNIPLVSVAQNNRTVLTMTVTPTYLYVMSEPDLNNPTITRSSRGAPHDSAEAP